MYVLSEEGNKTKSQQAIHLGLVLKVHVISFRRGNCYSGRCGNYWTGIRDTSQPFLKAS